MLLLLNILKDYNSEHRERVENKENQILKHKSVENLHTEIFHDNIIFDQCLEGNIVQREYKTLAIDKNVRQWQLDF